MAKCRKPVRLVLLPGFDKQRDWAALSTLLPALSPAPAHLAPARTLISTMPTYASGNTLHNRRQGLIYLMQRATNSKQHCSNRYESVDLSRPSSAPEFQTQDPNYQLPINI